jgi:flagellar motor switch protein FliN
VKDSIPNSLEDKDRVLEPFAHAVTAGFSAAARASLSSTAAAAGTGISSSSLRSALSAAMMTGIQFTWVSGISGRVLLLVSQRDLERIAGLVAGMECPEDVALEPEVMEACLQFFAGAMQATGESLANSHGLSIQSPAPELVNSDGKAETLLPLADRYTDAFCLTLRISMEGHPECHIQVWIDRELVTSLRVQLPQYAPTAAGETNPPAKSAGPAGSRRDGAKQQGNWNIDLILDVELEVVVSFGETQMPLRDILKLGVGSVIELEKAVNDPVAIFVKDKPIARGEVVMVDGNYGVKILEVESTADRIRSLG